eukprot:CCRYP_020715-RD/>CCRYP_020715-RD protein AED:0.25 eAED:0.37 QI:3132/0.66/0.25/1/0.33/0.25/4/0/235
MFIGETNILKIAFKVFVTIARGSIGALKVVMHFSFVAMIKQPINMILGIHTMHTKQIDILQSQPLNLFDNRRLKIRLGHSASNEPLGLNNQIFPFANPLLQQNLERFPNLHLRRAIPQSRLNMIHSTMQRMLQNIHEIFLAFRLHLFHGRDGLASPIPRLLETHASQCDDGHLEAGPSVTDFGDRDWMFQKVSERRAFSDQSIETGICHGLAVRFVQHGAFLRGVPHVCGRDLTA